MADADADDEDVDVEAEIRSAFGARIDACERLRDYVLGVFEDWPGRGIETTADALIGAIFARSFDTYSCVIRLAAGGYGTQGAMLNRSLFEDMADAHWVAHDPETAERRYEEHNEHGRMVLADAIKKHPEQYKGVEVPTFDPPDRKRLDRIFGDYGQKPWSTVSLHKRVELIQDQWSEHERRVLMFFRDIAHKNNNQTLHVSAASMNATVQLGGDPGRVAFKIGARYDMLAQTLFGAFWTFEQTVGLIATHFGFEIDEQTLQDVFAPRFFHTLTAEQRKRTGRNDPCPCGSGLKYKRCHMVIPA